MESIDCYRNEMMEHLPERDDSRLLECHKDTVERVMANIEGLKQKEAIGETFMDIIDLNWEKCEEICRVTLDRVESKILSDETESRSENYGSLMKRLREDYSADIGESLSSKMEFIRLEYLAARQDKDFDILMKEKQRQAIETGATAAVESDAAAGMVCVVECDSCSLRPASGDVSSDATSDATTSAGAAEVSDDLVLLSSDDETSETESVLNKSNDTYGITADLLRKHKALLKDRLEETQFGILDKLLASDGLTHQETTAIQKYTDPYVRSDKLIDTVLKKNIVPEFIEALVDTHQTHLVNYLRGDGVYSEEFGDDWPLTDGLIRRINVNQGNLIDTIDPSLTDLICKLQASKVINPRQYNFISEESSDLRKNTVLLNIIRRRSVKDYKSTLDCLIASNQKHIAEILEKGGVVIKLRSSQRGDPQTVSRIEDAISNQMLDLVRGLTIEEIQRTLELTQLKVYAAKKGQSIYLYVYCATLKELTELHDLLVTGTAKTIVETLFNRLDSREDWIVVSLTFSEEEYNECKLYFEDNFEKEQKLRMTWGRVMIFWTYWIECRKGTIDLLNNIFGTFLEEMPEDALNPVEVFLEWIKSHDVFEKYLLQFAHTINKDFSCYKVLLTKLTEFQNLVTSSRYLDAFGVQPKGLFFNISTFQSNISFRQSEMCYAFEMCGNIIRREQEGLGETAKLLACTSRPLLHLKDLLRKLSDEGRLNKAGIEGVVNDIHQEESDMTTMLSESLLLFVEFSWKVNNAAENLRKNIEEWLPKRAKSIAQLKEIIEKLNKVAKGVVVVKTVSTSVGIVGGAFAIGSLIMAPFTLGASLFPSAIAGAVTSGLGAATAIGASVAGDVIDKRELRKATTCIEEDRVLFLEVSVGIEHLNRISTMLQRYIPQDEMKSFISVMTDPQSTAMLSISSKSQTDPRIALNVERLVGIGGNSAVMQVNEVLMALMAAASKGEFLEFFLRITFGDAVLDITARILAGLGIDTNSETAMKLEKVVKKMEEEKRVIENILAAMS